MSMSSYDYSPTHSMELRGPAALPVEAIVANTGVELATHGLRNELEVLGRHHQNIIAFTHDTLLEAQRGTNVHGQFAAEAARRSAMVTQTGQELSTYMHSLNDGGFFQDFDRFSQEVNEHHTQHAQLRLDIQNTFSSIAELQQQHTEHETRVQQETAPPMLINGKLPDSADIHSVPDLETLEAFTTILRYNADPDLRQRPVVVRQCPSGYTEIESIGERMKRKEEDGKRQQALMDTKIKFAELHSEDYRMIAVSGELSGRGQGFFATYMTVRRDIETLRNRCTAALDAASSLDFNNWFNAHYPGQTVPAPTSLPAWETARGITNTAAPEHAELTAPARPKAQPELPSPEPLAFKVPGRPPVELKQGTLLALGRFTKE